MAITTFQEVVEHEPLLVYLETLICEGIYSHPDYAWTYGFRPIVERLVGFYCRNTPLENSEAYDVAMNHLKDLVFLHERKRNNAKL